MTPSSSTAKAMPIFVPVVFEYVSWNGIHNLIQLHIDNFILL